MTDPHATGWQPWQWLELWPCFCGAAVPHSELCPDCGKSESEMEAESERRHPEQLEARG